MKIQSKSALTASLLALIAAQPAAAEDLTIKFSAFVGERNPIFACSMIPLVEELEANQGTKVEVERYFGGGEFGNTTHVVPEETRMKMKEVIAPVIESHLKMLDDKGLPATEVRNRIDAELAKSN